MAEEGQSEAVIVIGDYIIDIFRCDDGRPGITVSKETWREWRDRDELEPDPPWLDLFFEVVDGRLVVRSC